MTVPECDPARPISRKPAFTLPEGAVDCHFHVFGPAARYPYAPGRSYTPPDAPLATYEHLADTIGFSRAVIVQPSVYGLDNRASMDAVAQSRLPMRAVVVVDPDNPPAELEAFHSQGARGVRVNLLFKAGLAANSATILADKIRDLGWHLQFLADVSQMPDLRRFVERLRIPVVFDHLGHIPAQKGIRDQGFQDLLGLVRDGLAWVKLSGGYRVTTIASPPYDDVAPFVEALLRANPNQLVWGTDWPHPSIPVAMPDDADLVDMFGNWVTDEDLRHRILVANPARLYSF